MGPERKKRKGNSRKRDETQDKMGEKTMEGNNGKKGKDNLAGSERQEGRQLIT